MTIVEIASESEAAAVYARLQALGEAWRPVEDVPCLVYLEAGSTDEVSRIPGVAACWEGRSGRIARLLHVAARHLRAGGAPGAADWPAAGGGPRDAGVPGTSRFRRRAVTFGGAHVAMHNRDTT